MIRFVGIAKSMSVLSTYLSDPFLYKLYSRVRKAGSLRSISLDLTHDCNLRCDGCYYFEEEMDKIAENKPNLEFAFQNVKE